MWVGFHCTIDPFRLLHFLGHWYPGCHISLLCLSTPISLILPPELCPLLSGFLPHPSPGCCHMSPLHPAAQRFSWLLSQLTPVCVSLHSCQPELSELPCHWTFHNSTVLSRVDITCFCLPSWNLALPSESRYHLLHEVCRDFPSGKDSLSTLYCHNLWSF